MSGDSLEVVLRSAGGSCAGTFVRGSDRGALFEADSILDGEIFSVSFAESAYGMRGLEAVGRRVGVPGATESQLGVKWHYLVSRVGLAPLKEFFIEYLDCPFPALEDTRVQHMGGYWTVNMDPESPEYTAPSPIAMAPDFFADQVERLSEGNGTLYPKCSVGYSTGMISHKGRALRLNSSSLVIHTNGVLPPLGALVCAQFRVPQILNHPVVLIRGMVKNRTSKEQKKGHMSTFEIRIRDIFDMDEGGAMLSFLESLAGKGS